MPLVACHRSLHAAVSCRLRLVRAATLCLRAFHLLWRLRICCLIFLVTRSIAAYKSLSNVLSEEVGAAHRQTDGTTELFSQDARVVVFKGDARVNGALIEVIKLLQPVQDVILNGFGQRYVVCRKNQLHGQKMQPAGNKIQRKCDGKAIPD